MNYSKSRHASIHYTKTSKPGLTPALILCLCFSFCLCSSLQAQDNSRLAALRQQQVQTIPLPADLVSVQPDQIPSTSGGLFSMAFWPWAPPLPPGCWKAHLDLQFYWSASLNAAFMDDRELVTLQALTNAVAPPLPSGTTNDPGPFGPQPDYSSNTTALYLTIPWATNGPAGQVCVQLHNTTNTLLYNLVSHPTLGDTPCASWPSECLLWGVPNTNVTSTNLFMAGRTNLFFWAKTCGPTNGQVLLTLTNGCTSLQAVINGATSSYTAFASTMVLVPGPVNTLNVGYDHQDGGSTQITDFTQQNVVAINGLDDRLTTLCASHNPLTSLDVHGLAGVQDIECYRCPNLTQVNVTHCPNLTRACFEQCQVQGVLDFTGDVNLQDIRGAVNQYTNVIFGGAGPKITHLCVRDNPQLGQNLLLTNFYSLHEWYIWNDSQTGAVTSATMPSTNLYDVEIYGNHFEYADFSGKAGLYTLLINDNNLTNLALAGCRGLHWLEAECNQLSTAALDTILVGLTNTGGSNRYVNVSRNPELPSPVGYAAADYLRTNLYWNVVVDGPGDGVPGDGNAITFVVWSNNTVKLWLQTNAPANITWHWSDGTSNVGVTSVSHTFQGAGAYPSCHTNYVTVAPASALWYFGKQTNDVQGIVGLYGLSNFSSLSYLYLYNDDLQQLSLAGCSSLRQLHLAANPVSSTVCDQWFIDLNNAVTNSVDPNNNALYYPVVAATANSLAARTSLTNKLWNLIPIAP